ncbi:phage baseplate assembly protein V [Methylocapsa polymorpha]|uniref:Phage baseplate assembly protein V n=1 Tax=Methylocapsa polymorpha TaxID=3080828 RepID=A0ABZ0HUQ0_9HYPH|nr:phage baseplate assembly protein V [Methylocapsa sp. RX1]
MKHLYGKYRGEVKNNLDPMLLGRLQVTAPAALGSALVWAMPCAPFAGSGVGFFALPPVGANVWVEFEAGNPESPIWSGCFWGLGEWPASMALPTMKVIKTVTATITINDLPGLGGVTIETKTGMKIAFDATSIQISNGVASVKLEGPKVSINGQALEVI